MTKKKVVILGGGQAALTAAFQLTHPSNPRHDEYDVTLYQLGFRLGGKGAAGRNLEPEYFHRIEEHGLHNWFGFYDNAFRQIKDCFAELDRAPDAALATWQEAFQPASEAVFTEDIQGRHVFWRIENPTNDEVPGTGGLLLPLWEYVVMAIEELGKRWGDIAGKAGLLTETHLFAGLEVELLSHVTRYAVDLVLGPKDHGGKLLYAAQELARAAGSAGAELVLGLLRHFMEWLWSSVKGSLDTNDDARHLWILANFGFGCISGIIDNDVLDQGFDVLNDDDFRPWLAKYAFPDGGEMLDSPIVRAVYDSSFAYVDGKEAYEAGTALRGMVRATFTYKGAFGWRFAAGTADTCYAPMYLVLKERGVKFRFFHRVKSVECGAGAGKPIEKIVLARQVDVAGGGEYQPLIDVKGLPCWPNRPLWDQIVDGEKLARSGVDLEQPPASFVDAGEVTLGKGDFDAVVLGISVAALPAICPTLVAASGKWRTMLGAIKTVRTEALQLWSTPTAYRLGWREMGRPIASWDYDDTNALNVWGDLTALVPVEGWTVASWTQNVSYFCSAMSDAVPDAGAKAQVRADAIRMLENGIGILWKDAVGDDGTFKWDLLLDARAGEHRGQERIDSQYYRANTAPTERYVLSVPGSSKHRLTANDPGEFANLYLAGDWTWCNLNSGCMEAATMSGMLCSLALSGFPLRGDIVGVDFG